jgi:hypothetical protein
MVMFTSRIKAFSASNTIALWEAVLRKNKPTNHRQKTNERTQKSFSSLSHQISKGCEHGFCQSTISTVRKATHTGTTKRIKKKFPFLQRNKKKDSQKKKKKKKKKRKTKQNNRKETKTADLDRRFLPPNRSGIDNAGQVLDALVGSDELNDGSSSAWRHTNCICCGGLFLLGLRFGLLFLFFLEQLAVWMESLWTLLAHRLKFNGFVLSSRATHFFPFSSFFFSSFVFAQLCFSLVGRYFLGVFSVSSF